MMYKINVKKKVKKAKAGGNMKMPNMPGRRR